MTSISQSIAPPTRSRAADLVELAKPRLNMMVLTTTVVGFHMAVRNSNDWRLLPATLMGTALCAAGASALNQYLEREPDALMRRTRNRPLPAGRIRPAEALGYGVGLCVGGLSILSMLVNPLTALLAAFTVLSYALIYTPLKRVTTWNTIIGALPGAIPPVLGWTAVRGQLGPQALALLAILFLWQIPHFMAIAILYRNDYAAAGFKMLPVVDEKLAATSRHIMLFSLALLAASSLPAFLGMASIKYLFLAVMLGMAFITAGAGCVSARTRGEARRLFLASIIYLPLLLAAMMVTRL
ncbi:MAG TPA: heme o synthase [Tepidisphaeraceae bacterium]|nr:heme o synthase [Tepidisphaeraceae bacterium]